jgi:hypothetical protein
MVRAAAIAPKPIGSFRVRPRRLGRGGHAHPGAGEPPGSAWARGLTTVTVTPLDGLPRPPAAPSLAGPRVAGYLARGQRQRVRPPGRARLLERIPWPLTLVRDLGKRRSAQRLALDT